MINTHRKLYKFLFIFSLAFFSFFTSLFITQVADAFGAPINSKYGWRIHPQYHDRRLHQGVDLAVDFNTLVPTPVSGTVMVAGDLNDRYGRQIVIKEDGKNIYWRIGHNERVLVPVGQHVNKGQYVVAAGSTGGSTGVHLHIERRTAIDYEGSHSEDPVPYLIAAGWDLTKASNYDYDDGSGVWNEIKKAISVDFDYTTYFNPSETLMELTQKIIGLIKATFVHLQESLLPLLIALITIELAWTMIKASLDGSFSAMMIIPAIIRYGFFITIAKSWDYIIDHVFVRFFEQMSETVTGSTKSVESFLNFDAIYTAVQKVMEHNMHPSIVFFEVWNYIPFLLQNILIWTILFLILGLMIWVMYKFVAFYLICAFGIVGIPLHFIPTISAKGKSMLGVVISSTLDLLLVSFLINIMVAQINSLPAIEADSLVGLTMFIITLFMLSIFVGKLSNNCSSMLSHTL